MGDQFRQLDHLDGARPVGQAADEAALLERRYQPVDARLGTQIERVLHLVEGGRNSGLLEALMDKPQQLGLLARQHRRFLLEPESPKAAPAKQIMNGHYPFHMCSATI